MGNLSVSERTFLRVDSLIWNVTKLLMRKKKIALEEFNLTCSQFDMLDVIYQLSGKKKGIIQINLAEKANIDPMTTSTILRNLEKRQLIKRERGLVNTRTVEIELTISGEALHCLAREKLEKMRQEIYQNLDRQQLAAQLLILTDKLNKY